MNLSAGLRLFRYYELLLPIEIGNHANDELEVASLRRLPSRISIN